MSTGLVKDAELGRIPNTNFGYIQSDPLRPCGVGTSKENLYYGMFINIPAGVTSLRVNYLFLTQELITGNQDSAIIYKDGIAQAQTGITAQSPLTNTGAMFGMSYARAGAISSYEFPVTPGSQQHLDFVLCEANNGDFDSALLADIVGLPLDPVYRYLQQYVKLNFHFDHYLNFYHHFEQYFKLNFRAYNKLNPEPEINFDVRVYHTLILRSYNKHSTNQHVKFYIRVYIKLSFKHNVIFGC
ncbi:uncharacterized protein CTRU02_208585 [Colletotrichum truncatum]|uniref:Uncharacterized protein n=1 Tax=Colletotrichum truncatum TaxID=5467 RepID=A0ACC3YWQ1_COLTU